MSEKDGSDSKAFGHIVKCHGERDERAGGTAEAGANTGALTKCMRSHGAQKKGAFAIMLLVEAESVLRAAKRVLLRIN
jgi:hypothetical protein